ncbi:MAG TPA: hypothetical protein VKF59_20940, partial [Candidatus Dormibacteraeota bacterium]|nr:hypothetical protein [Candidatus Dormibacteraeota bacterium]
MPTLIRGAARAAAPRLRLLLGGAVVAAAVVLLLPVTASAHALVVRSDPAAGSSLAQVPRAVTITFS